MSTRCGTFATGKLAHYKIPRYVHIVDEFPMTVTGKVRKVDMRAAMVETAGPEYSREIAPRSTKWRTPLDFLRPNVRLGARR